MPPGDGGMAVAIGAGRPSPGRRTARRPRQPRGGFFVSRFFEAGFEVPAKAGALTRRPRRTRDRLRERTIPWRRAAFVRQLASPPPTGHDRTNPSPASGKRVP